MRLKLECTEGPRKGDLFTIRGEITLGRKAELALRDSKASSQHAKITTNPDDLPVLEDLGSANGTKLNGQRIKSPTPLKTGDEIQIGSTKLKVLDLTAQQSSEVPAETAKVESSIHDAWAKPLEKLLLKTQPSRKKAEPPKMFSPCVELSVQEGLQAGQSWTLGFGPRRFGAKSSDIVLIEEKSPDLAFEIIPQDNGSALFKTNHPNEVLLNNEVKDSQRLKDDDEIQIGLTKLHVRISEAL